MVKKRGKSKESETTPRRWQELRDRGSIRALSSSSTLSSKAMGTWPSPKYSLRKPEKMQIPKVMIGGCKPQSKLERWCILKLMTTTECLLGWLRPHPSKSITTPNSSLGILRLIHEGRKERHFPLQRRKRRMEAETGFAQNQGTVTTLAGEIRVGNNDMEQVPGTRNLKYITPNCYNNLKR